jgi:hypothetical protein
MDWSKIATIGGVISIPTTLAIYITWTLTYGPSFTSKKMIIPAIILLCFLTILGFTAVGIFKTVYGSPELISVPTELRIQFNSGSTLPFALAQPNVWRWYALYNATIGIAPDGKQTLLSKTWNLFLTFDKPIPVKQIRVDAGGAVLPTYEVKDFSNRSAVIAFSGDLAGVVMDVQVVN